MARTSARISSAPSSTSWAATCWPSSAAWSAGPRASPRTARLPSGDTTTAMSSSSWPSTGDASAPIGVWHPPPSAATSARSARQGRGGRRVVDACHDDGALPRRPRGFRSRRCPVPARGHTPSPATSSRCATQTRGAAVRRPRGRAHRIRRRSSLRRRVSRLPRIGVKRAPGISRVSCAIRRTLPVPTTGEWPSSATRSSMVADGRWLQGASVVSRGHRARREHDRRPTGLRAAARRRSASLRAARPTCPCCCGRRGRCRRRAGRPRFP